MTFTILQLSYDAFVAACIVLLFVDAYRSK